MDIINLDALSDIAIASLLAFVAALIVTLLEHYL